MHTSTRPYSDHYKEHYWWWGAAEKAHVFVCGNSLPARFAQAGQGANPVFTVSELGFGTGLNALLTLHLWQTHNPTGHLTYISYEKHPFPRADLTAIHATFPAHLHPLAHALQTAYNPQLGWNTLHLPHTTLHLYIGDAATGIQTHPHPADCWFLDGFSPAANPEMWSPHLMQSVYANTVPGGTASTYSVARSVKDALTASGFTIARQPGHPPKEHMLVATK